MSFHSAKFAFTFFILIVGLWIVSCKKDEQNLNVDQVPPGVETGKITDSTEYTAKGGGKITVAGGSPIITRGLVWGLSETLDTTMTTKAKAGTGRGTFLADMKGLAPNTKYYYTAFAANEIGLSYGEIKSFTTKPLPPGYASLGPTDEATAITFSSAISGGSVISDGTFPILFRGVCWGKTTAPTVALSTRTKDSGTSFISKLKGLSPLTQYFVRAYATNVKGTSYGNEISFTTPNDPNGGTVTDLEGNTYRTIKIGTQLWMSENLRAKSYQNGDTIKKAVRLRFLLDWKNSTIGTYPEFEEVFHITYGKLYNYYAVTDPRKVCPVGWHVPDSSEFELLIKSQGNSAEAGGKLKAFSAEWNPNIGASNESGFSALPAGLKTDLFADGSRSLAAFFWSTSQSKKALTRGVVLQLKSNNANSDLENPLLKNNGLSVRCVKD